MDASLAGTETVGLAWVALLAFIRIGTNPSILPNPMTADEATGQAETWLGADIVSFDRDLARFSGVRHRVPG